MATAAALRPSGPRKAVSAAGLLHAARSRIADPSAWTPSTGPATALTRDGQRVLPADPRACRFDGLAALQRAAWSERLTDYVLAGAYDSLIAALRAVEAEAGAPLREVGAQLDHADVLDLLDRAAERAPTWGSRAVD